MIADLTKLLTFLPRHRQRQFRWLLLVAPLVALLEAGTVGAVWAFLIRLAKAGAVHASAVAIVAVVAVGTGLARLYLTRLTQRFTHGASHDLTVAMARSAFAQPLDYQAMNHSSQLVGALEKVEQVGTGLILQSVQMVSAMLIGAAITAMLLWIAPISTFVGLAVLGVSYLAIAIPARREIRRHAASANTAYAARVAAIQDGLGTVRETLLTGGESPFLAHLRSADRTVTEARARIAIVSATPRFLIEAVGIVVVALFALALSRTIGLAAALPVLGAFALGAQRLLPIAQQIYGGWASIVSTRPLASDVIQLLNLDLGTRASHPHPFTREIRADGAQFTYPGQGAPAIADASLTITRGSRVAIVGSTGAGKSTLLDLLMGLIVPQAGELKVDGDRLSADDLAAWRLNFALVSQEPYLFDGTIGENIALSGDWDEIAMARCVDVALLSDVVDRQPEGLNSHVGERGCRLSGGERQRVAIARALYRGRPILVLDEATNALDPATEEALLSRLTDALGREQTIIVVSHRSSVEQWCDATIRVERGRVSSGAAVA